MTNPWLRRTFVAAPVLLLIGVVALKFGWKGHPDLDWPTALTVWTVAHGGYVLGNLGLGVVLAALWSRGRRAARTTPERIGVDVVGVAGVVGTVAILGQMVIDLIVGFRADSRAAMSPISKSIHDLPGFEAFFYGVVPMLGMAAIAVLLLQLAVRREVLAWAAVLYMAGSLTIATQVAWPMVLGGVAVAIALIAVSRPTARYVDPHGLHALGASGGLPRAGSGVHQR
jgi:hypothetical protein